jgi:hypothetical protein
MSLDKAVPDEIIPLLRGMLFTVFRIFRREHRDQLFPGAGKTRQILSDTDLLIVSRMQDSGYAGSGWIFSEAAFLHVPGVPDGSLQGKPGSGRTHYELNIESV